MGKISVYLINIIKRKGESELRKNKKDVVEEVQKKEIKCFVLTDNIKPTMLEYLRSCGLNVEKIWSNPEDAIDDMSIIGEEYRLVIIETGTGEFSTISCRDRLVEVIEVATINNSVSIFYTDGALRSSCRLNTSIQHKMVSWSKYKSTIECIASVLKLGELYVCDSSDDEETRKGWLDEPLSKFVARNSDEDKIKTRREFITASDIAGMNICGEEVS